MGYSPWGRKSQTRLASFHFQCCLQVIFCLCAYAVCLWSTELEYGAGYFPEVSASSKFPRDMGFLTWTLKWYICVYALTLECQRAFHPLETPNRNAPGTPAGHSTACCLLLGSLTNESYVIFPSRTRCCFILFWVFASQHAFAVSSTFSPSSEGFLIRCSLT